ncbi:MAG: RimK family alpha-L-glutamate ligase [Clostridia bacterium]|nr:RimK family alpha-L-glutamate ligase [Clostridia bacterium]
MRSLIIINGYPRGEKFFTQGKSIQKSLERLGVSTDLKKNGEVFAILQKDGRVQAEFAKQYDFMVYLDKDKYLPRMLEKLGVRLFNRSESIETCDDKMLTYLALSNSGLLLAKTISAPLCYTEGAEVNDTFLRNVADELGFPLVAKECYGSFGTGVHLVHGMPELKEVAQKCLQKPHLFQEYLAESSGRDVRVIVVGGTALGCMERVAQAGEFRSNIELGGTGRKVELPSDYIKTAERVAEVLGLDYCGVDLLETREGPVVCEVNSNAFFEGFEQVTGLNVSDAYAAHIVKTMKK